MGLGNVGLIGLFLGWWILLGFDGLCIGTIYFLDFWIVIRKNLVLLWNYLIFFKSNESQVFSFSIR